MQGDVHHDTENDTFYFACPHCGVMCEVPKALIRCGIFRHAVHKGSMKFVDPHASRKECEEWLRNGVVHGCAKPFRFDGEIVAMCEYI